MTMADISRPATAPLPRDCTFDPADWAILARYWYPVALSRDVTTAPVAATLLDNIVADRSSVAYRRGLRDLGLSHIFTA